MSMTFAKPETLDHERLEHGSTFAPRFDANGLVTVVTVEHGTNEVLMLAHMNADALALTLETGFAHYWSRSRSKLWKKGESSGELQRLVELRTDCDQDAMVMTVEQTGRGAACHTGRKSCFYRRALLVDGNAVLEDTGMPQIFDPNKVY
ncbi:phosphoribosyl-AMP cyclohydrolase [Devosia pacifica]|uniref:Phosphoribosyl-AMP cyclohydrolase n=1 Tax=Devosia pacifica TaxID=1335967 RepID=A0A918VQC9_9HYPH|nr:phosphoribosyl-AMP cyclohydrolase [Devosia pacifica]GHA13987.1 phosphoribosyl-AMP cyclohydrolase [Devosia pacifica]